MYLDAQLMFVPRVASRISRSQMVYYHCLRNLPVDYIRKSHAHAALTDTHDFPLASEMNDYLVSYANHFDLVPRARLSTLVHRAHWVEKKGRWEIEISTGEGPRVTEDFDKVVYSMGSDQIPNIPAIPGIEKFVGDVMHSVSFKQYAWSRTSTSSKANHIPLGLKRGTEKEFLLWDLATLQQMWLEC